MAEAMLDIWEPAYQKEFPLYEQAKAPDLKPLSKGQLQEHAVKIGGAGATLPETPSLELTARHPYDPAGFLEAYQPGRWDCERDLVFMMPIRYTGNGYEWKGSVLWAHFLAPDDGTYLVVATFSGLELTMTLRDPSGMASTAYCATVHDGYVPVCALWAGSKGTHATFALSCTGPILGYLESVKAYRIA